MNAPRVCSSGPAPLPTFFAAASFDRRKKPAMIEVRRMTTREIFALKAGQHKDITLTNGRIGMVKINGAIKTWKSIPGCIEVPVKYGLREYDQWSMKVAVSRFVVRV